MRLWVQEMYVMYAGSTKRLYYSLFWYSYAKTKLRHDEQLRLPEPDTANGSKMSCRITAGWLSKYRLLLIELVGATSMQLRSGRPNPAAEACGPRHQ